MQDVFVIIQFNTLGVHINSKTRILLPAITVRAHMDRQLCEKVHIKEYYVPLITYHRREGRMRYLSPNQLDPKF